MKKNMYVYRSHFLEHYQSIYRVVGGKNRVDDGCRGAAVDSYACRGSALYRVTVTIEPSLPRQHGG